MVGSSFRTSSLESQQRREGREERLKDWRPLQRLLQASERRELVLVWWILAEKALFATGGRCQAPYIALGFSA